MLTKMSEYSYIFFDLFSHSFYLSQILNTFLIVIEELFK